MNYRHAYHAGNFADVLKHAVLALVIEYMKAKPRPFRVIDVHAGVGRYDLEGEEANKTDEWHGGIGRLMGAAMSDAQALLLKPYLDAVAALNPDLSLEENLRFYPGSPLLARMLMRRGDTLVANELHPADFELLKMEFRGAPHTRVTNLDAFVALKSLLPPPERRGLMLVDPPFEVAGEFERIIEGLSEAVARFATGTYLIWYPVKDPAEVTRFLTRLRALGLAKLINVTMAVAARDGRKGLNETGLAVVNPPFVLKSQIETILPLLTDRLAAGAGAFGQVEDWSN